MADYLIDDDLLLPPSRDVKAVPVPLHSDAQRDAIEDHDNNISSHHLLLGFEHATTLAFKNDLIKFQSSSGTYVDLHGAELAATKSDPNALKKREDINNIYASIYSE